MLLPLALFSLFYLSGGLGIVGFQLDNAGNTYCHEVKEEMLSTISFYLAGKHSNVSLQRLLTRQPPGEPYFEIDDSNAV